MLIAEKNHHSHFCEWCATFCSLSHMLVCVYMIHYRRTIAALILALFTCQLLLVVVIDHAALYKEVAHSAIALGEKADNSLANDSALEDITDQNCGHCCHGHGHCHAVTYAGLFPHLAMDSGRLLLSHDRSYYSLYFNTLFRPPISA
jgi:hypothetical protein